VFPKHYNRNYTDDKLYAVYVDYTGVSFQIEQIDKLKEI